MQGWVTFLAVAGILAAGGKVADDWLLKKHKVVLHATLSRWLTRLTAARVVDLPGLLSDALERRISSALGKRKCVQFGALLLWATVLTNLAFAFAEMWSYETGLGLGHEPVPAACASTPGLLQSARVQYPAGVLRVFSRFFAAMLSFRTQKVELPLIAINFVFDGLTLYVVYAVLRAASQKGFVRATAWLLLGLTASVVLAWFSGATLHWYQHAFQPPFREVFLETGLTALWYAGFQKRMLSMCDFSGVDLTLHGDAMKNQNMCLHAALSPPMQVFFGVTSLIPCAIVLLVFATAVYLKAVLKTVHGVTRHILNRIVQDEPEKVAPFTLLGGAIAFFVVVAKAVAEMLAGAHP